ncbi:hypothetical protein QVD17_37459 [Tagetes erecta]|uniref:Uncharacterized protein n=1 Tax=Tagetes erecta TaxID=13708 RepID=A0AAD8JUM7_TARER|nr:hypothetical protein QVD17_37459 [Tagetes erecta]
MPKETTTTVVNVTPQRKTKITHPHHFNLRPGKRTTATLLLSSPVSSSLPHHNTSLSRTNHPFHGIIFIFRVRRWYNSRQDLRQWYNSQAHSPVVQFAIGLYAEQISTAPRKLNQRRTGLTLIINGVVYC